MDPVSLIFSLGLTLIEIHEHLTALSLELNALSLAKEAVVILTSITLAIKTPCQRIMNINWSSFPNSNNMNQIQSRVKLKDVSALLEPLILFPFLRKL